MYIYLYYRVYKYVEIFGLIFVIIHIYKQIKGCSTFKWIFLSVPTQHFYPGAATGHSVCWVVFGRPVAAKQSRGYCATLWRSHNRDKYYCVGFSHILVENMFYLINITQLSAILHCFLRKKIRDICRDPSPPTRDWVRFGSSPSSP